MRHRRYRVSLVGFEEPPPRRRRLVAAAVAAVASWWAWSWQLRLASLCVLLGLVLLLFHFT